MVNAFKPSVMCVPFFCFQREPFKTTLGCEHPLSRSPTPTRPAISTMQPPLTPWTEATIHRGATQVLHPQTAPSPQRVQPVKTQLVFRTTGYLTATSLLKPGTSQSVPLTTYWNERVAFDLFSTSIPLHLITNDQEHTETGSGEQEVKSSHNILTLAQIRWKQPPDWAKCKHRIRSLQHY